MYYPRIGWNSKHLKPPIKQRGTEEFRPSHDESEIMCSEVGCTNPEERERNLENYAEDILSRNFPGTDDSAHAMASGAAHENSIFR